MTAGKRVTNIKRRISNYKLLNPTFLERYLKCLFLVFLISSLCLLALAGCNKANEKAQLLEQVKQLTEEKSQLTSRIEESESQKKQLQEQVQVLSALPEEVKGENLYKLRQINIGRFTDFYDKDDDSQKETLIVYVQTIDDQGDKIKASGTAEVELWDLNQPNGQAKIKNWKVGHLKLKQLWFSTMLSINYRLTFDISGLVEDFDKPYTVKVKFTDYLSGKVFEDQKVIEP